MNRRSFLRLKMPALQAAKTQGRTNTGLSRYNGSWTKNEVQHLLKRVLFGSTKRDIDRFTGLGMSATLDAILNYSNLPPSPPVNEYQSKYPDPVVPAGNTWVNNISMDALMHHHRRLSFRRWWMGLMINQESNIREKMTLFWGNLFGTLISEIMNANMGYAHYKILRDNAVGNYRLMVKLVTKDAGMLEFLNGSRNFKDNPDENYARELQELFTLGKGPEVQYSEDDVRSAARILTGWRIDNSTFGSYFDAQKHDTGNKTFSAYYGNKVILGRTGVAGAEETDELIDMILEKEEVSKFICRRLYRWFVYYKIDGATEQNVITPLAKIFRDNNYEVKPVLRALFESEHFYDVLNQGCLIKSPVDYVVGCLREFNVVFPANYVNAYLMWHSINYSCANMNQEIGEPPNVSGWPAYYQEPLFHELWINSDTLPKRVKFSDTILTSGFTESGQKIIIDVIAFVKTLSNPADPNILIDDALQIMYRAPLSAQSKQAIKQQILLSNQTQDAYWTDAWNAYTANPTSANLNIVSNRLKSLFQYLMNLPEYQLS